MCFFDSGPISSLQSEYPSISLQLSSLIFTLQDHSYVGYMWQPFHFQPGNHRLFESIFEPKPYLFWFFYSVRHWELPGRK